MLPHVVIHNEISLDARMDRLDVDMGRFYGLAAMWKEDVTLVGSDTILAAMPELAEAPPADKLPAAAPSATAETAARGSTPAPAEALPEGADRPPAAAAAGPSSTSAPLLAAVDGRGRLAGLAVLRAQPYWRDVVALCSMAAPAQHLGMLSRQGVDHLVAGAERVDLRTALEWLAERHDARLVRVDAGGTLVGALLRAGLVDEVSVVVEPRLVGGESPKWLFQAPDTAADDDVAHLRLQHLERFDDDAVWLRYEVVRGG